MGSYFTDTFTTSFSDVHILSQSPCFQILQSLKLQFHLPHFNAVSTPSFVELRALISEAKREAELQVLKLNQETNS